MRFIHASILLLVMTFLGAGFSECAADNPRLRIPQRFKHLYKLGNVTTEFYDPVTDPMDYQGHASFQLDARTRFAYDYRFVVRGSKRHIRIKPRVEAFTWDLRHTVKIPESQNTAGLWHGKLMLHELDHVAISTDPRAKMLLEHLLRSSKVIEKPVPRRGNIEASVIRGIVQAEHIARRDALLDLMKKCNRDLDRITKHGVKPLADRDAFFENLYTKSGLDSYGFPYLGEVLNLLKQKKYKTAKLLHHSGRKTNDS